MNSFSILRRVQFSEGDPAGISFFSNVYRWHHEVYERWVCELLAFDYSKWFLSKAVGIPLRKSEAEYFGPFLPGKNVRIDLQLTHVGTSSFTLISSQYNDHGLIGARVQTVHVFMDLKTGKKVEIPEEFRKALVSQLSQDG
jgi:YbgC/YbaW family acyl-CoA thioester hydrolase